MQESADPPPRVEDFIDHSKYLVAKREHDYYHSNSIQSHDENPNLDDSLYRLHDRLGDQGMIDFMSATFGMDFAAVARQATNANNDVNNNEEPVNVSIETTASIDSTGNSDGSVDVGILFADATPRQPQRAGTISVDNAIAQKMVILGVTPNAKTFNGKLSSTAYVAPFSLVLKLLPLPFRQTETVSKVLSSPANITFYLVLDEILPDLDNYERKSNDAISPNGSHALMETIFQRMIALGMSLDFVKLESIRSNSCILIKDPRDSRVRVKVLEILREQIRLLNSSQNQRGIQCITRAHQRRAGMIMGPSGWNDEYVPDDASPIKPSWRFPKASLTNMLSGKTLSVSMYGPEYKNADDTPITKEGIVGWLCENTEIKCIETYEVTKETLAFRKSKVDAGLLCHLNTAQSVEKWSSLGPFRRDNIYEIRIPLENGESTVMTVTVESCKRAWFFPRNESDLPPSNFRRIAQVVVFPKPLVKQFEGDKSDFREPIAVYRPMLENGEPHGMFSELCMSSSRIGSTASVSIMGETDCLPPLAVAMINRGVLTPSNPIKYKGFVFAVDGYCRPWKIATSVDTRYDNSANWCGRGKVGTDAFDPSIFARDVLNVLEAIESSSDDSMIPVEDLHGDDED